jgi:hypothetical protein
MWTTPESVDSVNPSDNSRMRSVNDDMMKVPVFGGERGGEKGTGARVTPLIAARGALLVIDGPDLGSSQATTGWIRPLEHSSGRVAGAGGGYGYGAGLKTVRKARSAARDRVPLSCR